MTKATLLGESTWVVIPITVVDEFLAPFDLKSWLGLIVEQSGIPSQGGKLHGDSEHLLSVKSERHFVLKPPFT